MNFLAITIYVWMGMLVLKGLGFPLVKEITWSQLFLVPVMVFLVRIGVILFGLVVFFLTLWFLWWLSGWSVENLDLMTGY